MLNFQNIILNIMYLHSENVFKYIHIYLLNEMKMHFHVN